MFVFLFVDATGPSACHHNTHAYTHIHKTVQKHGHDTRSHDPCKDLRKSEWTEQLSFTSPPPDQHLYVQNTRDGGSAVK